MAHPQTINQHASSDTDMPDQRHIKDRHARSCISNGFPMRHVGLKTVSDQAFWSPMRHIGLRWVSNEECQSLMLDVSLR